MQEQSDISTGSNKMKKNNKYDLTEFSTLLRRNIGNQSQTLIAEKTGISREVINRWINDKATGRPDKTSLKKLASYFPGVTYNQFLEACGYEAETLQSRIDTLENELALGVKEMKGGLWKSMPDFLDAFFMLYSTDGNFVNSDHLKEEKLDTSVISDPFVSSGADYRVSVKNGIRDDEYLCYTTFDIYYSKTERGYVTIIGSTLEEKKDTDIVWNPETQSTYRNTTIVKKDKAAKNKQAEKRLLDAIFNHASVDAIVNGYGFYINEIPDGFADFFTRYSELFCVNENFREKYQKYMTESISLEECLEGYSNHVGNKWWPDYISFIVSVMRKVYHLDVLFVEGNESEDGQDTSAIMISDDTPFPEEPSKEQELKMLECAKILKIKSFGQCYVKIQTDFVPQNETDKFFIKEK